MERVIQQETGNSAAIGLRHPLFAPGQLLLEGLFVLQSVAPRGLQAGRFLPPTPVRVLIDLQGRRYDDRLACHELTDSGEALETPTLAPVVRGYRAEIRRLVELAEEQAGQRTTGLIEQAVQRMMEHYTTEIQRLSALQRHNPNVRDEEIEALQAQAQALHQHLQAARLRLDAVRLVVTL